MVTKKLLQIFCSSFLSSYATSYATLHTAVMRSTEFKRVQLLSLLFSTSLRLKQRKHERFKTSSSIVCCGYSLSYCISPTHPWLFIPTCWSRQYGFNFVCHPLPGFKLGTLGKPPDTKLSFFKHFKHIWAKHSSWSLGRLNPLKAPMVCHSRLKPNKLKSFGTKFCLAYHFLNSITATYS